MPRITLANDNLTASTKTSNLLAGGIFEFTPQDGQSTVTIHGVSSAAGVNMTIQADSDVLVDDQVLANIGTTALVPDHLITSFDVEPGTRLVLTLRETAAAATTDTRILVDVE